MFSIRYFIKIVRPLNLLIILFTMYMVRFGLLNPMLKAEGLKLQLNEIVFAVFSLAFVLTAAGGYVINDYYDVKIDSVNKPGKVIIGKYIKPSSVLIFYYILSVAGLISGFWVSFKMGLPWFGLIFLIYFFGLWLYSNSLKRIFFIGNFIIALFIALVPLASGVAELNRDICYYSLNEFENAPLGYIYIFGISLFAFLSILMREIVKDMEDKEGDRVAGCRTVPIVLGDNVTKRIIQFILLTILFFIGYLEYVSYRTMVIGFLTFNFLGPSIYIAVFIQLPILFILTQLNKASTPKDFHMISSQLKLLMVSGICFLFVFALI